jgi:hypothetical protein
MALDVVQPSTSNAQPVPTRQSEPEQPSTSDVRPTVDARPADGRPDDTRPHHARPKRPLTPTERFIIHERGYARLQGELDAARQTMATLAKGSIRAAAAAPIGNLAKFARTLAAELTAAQRGNDALRREVRDAEEAHRVCKTQYGAAYAELTAMHDTCGAAEAVRVLALNEQRQAESLANETRVRRHEARAEQDRL